MMPDIKTLMLLYLITNVVNTGAIAVIWRQNQGRFAGISFWLVTMALQVAGSVLHVLRGLVPDLISMTLANTIILVGVLIMLMGLERFTGKKGWQVHNYVLLAVFIAVSAYFVVVQPNLLARDIAVSAMLMIYTFQCCWLLLYRVAHGMRRITHLTGIVFAIYAAFNFARIILNIIFSEQSYDFYKSGAVNALAITCYIVLNLCLAISLVLMVNRRLLADVNAQEEKFTRAFHSSPYAITLTKPSDDTIFEVNVGFVNITGYQYAEIIGKTTHDLHLWDREEDRLAVINEFAQGHDIHGVEYQFRDKTGKVLTGLFSASLITINNETCILSSIGDITELKKAQQELNKSYEQVRSLASRLQETREETRTRISRDIHDELGGALAGLKMDLLRLEPIAASVEDRGKGQALLDIIHGAKELINDTIRSTRRIITEQRPSVLDDFGLVAAMEWQLGEFKTHAGISFEFNVGQMEIDIDRNLATVVFRIFQEALTNVTRHSKATEVYISLRVDEGQLSLEIKDNGRGITDDEIIGTGALGILGIRERALALGGEVNIAGESGKGTTLNMKIPVQ
jgi:PAS domain S-box-containing protein